jgi:hypothetical protein
MSKKSSKPEVTESAPVKATFYRIVQKSTYEHELQAVQVDLQEIPTERVGDNDILSIVTRRLTRIMSGGDV